MGTKTRLDGLLDRITLSQYEAVKITVVPNVLRELRPHVVLATTRLDGGPTYRGVPVVVGTLERGDNWSIQLRDVVLSEGLE